MIFENKFIISSIAANVIIAGAKDAVIIAEFNPTLL